MLVVTLFFGFRNASHVLERSLLLKGKSAQFAKEKLSEAPLLSNRPLLNNFESFSEKSSRAIQTEFVQDAFANISSKASFWLTHALKPI